MAVVRMAHPKEGELMVPERAVKRYQKYGWRAVQPAKKAAAAAESKES